MIYIYQPKILFNIFNPLKDYQLIPGNHYPIEEMNQIQNIQKISLNKHYRILLDNKHWRKIDAKHLLKHFITIDEFRNQQIEKLKIK